MAGIVVGVDGSPHSQNALDWALAEAEYRHTPLTVVAIVPGAASIWGIAGRDDASEETRGEDQARGGGNGRQVGFQPPRPAGDRAHRQRRARRRAHQASQGADLLVVAARGARGFARLKLGSVSQQVAAHALCPVTIVPAAEDH